MKRLLIAALLFGMVSTAHAARDDVKAAIQAGNAAWLAAFAKGDAKAVAALYTETATMLPAGAPMQKGRAAIEAFVKGMTGSGMKNVVLTTTDVMRTGPQSAREIGTFTFEAPDAQKQMVKTEGKYVVNWRRVNGTWMLETDIFNMNK